MRSIAPILLLPWPGEASRPLESMGATELFLTVSAVCSQRNERSGSLLHLSADAEWSAAAAKLASQSSGAGGTVRMLGAKHECKYPLCDAGFWHAQAVSLGVILLCPGRGEASRPRKGNCATCRADQSVVVPTHSKTEERSDEKFNNCSAIAADIDA